MVAYSHGFTFSIRIQKGETHENESPVDRRVGTIQHHHVRLSRSHNLHRWRSTYNHPGRLDGSGTVLTCPGLQLLPSLDGKTAVFLDPDGSISDFVLLANVGTAVQFTFVSDLETGPPLTPPPPIIQPEVTEPNLFIVVATSPTGAQVRFTFTSDVNEAAGVPSETIQITPIPEPASLTLAGLGGLLIMCACYLRRRVRAA